MDRFRFLLPILAGALAATGFAPLWNWPLALLALAGFVALTNRAATLKRALLAGWLFGVGHFSVGLNWIAHAFTYQDAMPHWFGYGAVVLLSLYLAVYPAAAAGLAWRWGRHDPRVLVLVFGAAWIVTEWLRATMFTGFAWNPLGVIGLGLGIDHAARVTGTYGLSGLIILLAGALWLILQPQFRRTGYAMLAGFALLWASVALLPTVPPERGPAIVVVQPNIGQETKHDPRFDEANWRRLERLSGRQAGDDTPRIIFWPEAAVPAFIEYEISARDRIARLLGRQDLLVTGGDTLVYDDAGALTGAHNSVFIVDAEGELLGRYDKAHLVPYGEYLPMRPLLTAIGLSRLVPGDIDFWSGPGPRSLALAGAGSMGVQICYEIVFSGQVVDRANRPAFIFNPSNDAWFGSWGPPQHLAQARLRAIEEGLPVIRSTPTGISAVIDANGRVIDSIALGQAGAIDARLPAPLPLTPFARLGNILPMLLTALMIIIAVAIPRRTR